MIHKFKIENTARGDVGGRVSGSAQLDIIPQIKNRFLFRASTDGKETDGRTPSSIRLPGQALVILLVFVATATIITAGAVTVTLINARSTGKLAQGEEALQVTEAGAENEILKLLRNPAYNGASISEATLTVGNGSAAVTLVGPLPNITITSTGSVGSFTRKVQVKGTFSNDKFIPDPLTFWQEIN